MVERDTSWYSQGLDESGYMSRHTTLNNTTFNGSYLSTDDEDGTMTNGTFIEDEVVMKEPTALDGVSVHIEPAPSTTSRASLSSIVFGGFVGCMQPIKFAFSSFHNLFNPWIIDGNEIVIRREDYYSHGMEGTVYRTRYRDTEVAVKLVKDPKQFKPELIEKLARLNHRNIVTFHGYCVDPPQYVMEFLPHGTLERYLRNGGEVEPNLLVRWGSDVAAGLAQLHSIGLVHCDLKSANVMIGYNRKSLKLIDFESSKQLENSQPTQMRFVGTITYMAPEMLQEIECSEKIDIWSYAVILWEMLTLKIPFEGLGEEQVMFGVGTGKLSLPVPPDAPEGVKLLLQICWKREPEQRPDAALILKHLEQLQREFKNGSMEDYRQSQMSWRESSDADYPNIEFRQSVVQEWRLERRRLRQLEKQQRSELEIAMKLRADAQSLYLENLTRNKELRIMKEKLKKENKRCNFFSKHRKSPKRRRKRTKSNHQSLHLSPPQTLARSCSAPDLTHNARRHPLPPKSNTLNNRFSHGSTFPPLFHSSQEDLATKECREALSPLESDASRDSAASARLGDIESGPEGASPLRHPLSKLPPRRPKIASLPSSSSEDDAYDSLTEPWGDVENDLSPFSDLTIRPRSSSASSRDGANDEFAEESLEKFGVTC